MEVSDDFNSKLGNLSGANFEESCVISVHEKPHTFEASAGLEVLFLGPVWLRVVGLEANLAASWKLLTRPWLQIGGAGSDLGSKSGDLGGMFSKLEFNKKPTRKSNPNPLKFVLGALLGGIP